MDECWPTPEDGRLWAWAGVEASGLGSGVLDGMGRGYHCRQSRRRQQQNLEGYNCALIVETGFVPMSWCVSRRLGLASVPSPPFHVSVAAHALNRTLDDTPPAGPQINS